VSIQPHLHKIVKYFVKFGLRKIKKSFPKAALGIRIRILRLTSKNHLSQLWITSIYATIPLFSIRV
jgi:hypothetical protein